MAQQLRALVTLAEKPGLVLSTQMMLITCNFRSSTSDALFWLLWECMYVAHTFRINIYLYENHIFFFFGFLR